MGPTALLETTVTIVAVVASCVGLIRWSRFLAGRYGAPRWIRYVGPVCVGIVTLGFVGTILGLIHTFSAVSAPGSSAADRQRVLANGIAEAMYNTVIVLGAAAICVVFLLLLTWRYHWSAKDPKVEGSPPYR